MMNSTNTVTISTNYWRVPSPDTALNGWLEGSPTPEQRQAVVEAAKAARRSWKPRPEGLQLVEQLKEFVGSRIKIQFWDSCMTMLEEEAPYPLEADLVDVTLQEVGGFPQAFLLVKNVRELPNADGYSAMGYLQKLPDCNLQASLADLYEISRVWATSE